ncbi:hypothetical protein SBA2_350008 [Acidobacteriia bacterium SbA2]|nr:hypothetical protein SBA2_350008 [Acidobacteriia bacterium SbA2]
MKLSGQGEKWGIAILGVVSLLLIVRLVIQYNQMRATVKLPVAKARTQARAGAPAGTGAVVVKQPLKPRAPDDLSIYNSIVNVDLLKKYEERPLPELHRDPFTFVAVAAPPRVQAPGVAAAPPPAPPPPPLNLKVMGYTEGKGAADEAMVELCAASCETSSPDDQVLVVHAGDPVGSRYKVIKINPTVVTVEDAAIHQTVDLPIPQ